MMLSESVLNYASTSLIRLCNVYTEHRALDLLQSSDMCAHIGNGIGDVDTSSIGRYRYQIFV